MARSKSKNSQDVLKRFLRNEAVHYLNKENVTSVGLGYKIVSGKKTNDLSVQFTVHEKSDLDVLESLDEEPLPESFLVDGVEILTDVIERSFEPSFKEIKFPIHPEAVRGRKVVNDPIVPGISVGQPETSAGTIGCVVVDQTSGHRVILSNWHVLQGRGGSIGDDILQPGKHDDNRIKKNVVGTLLRSHLGRAGDCAIGSIESRNLESAIYDLDVSVKRVADPDLGDKVIKSGRTTSVTFGIVSRIHVTSDINYGTRSDPMIERIGGFEITPDPRKPADRGEISMPGDSGSSWMGNVRNKASDVMLGLHFAGERGNNPEHALACYASSVFEKLEIVPEGTTSSAQLTGSIGFDPDFLRQTVDLPAPIYDDIVDDLVLVDGSSVIEYTHFSLMQSKVRKFAYWVAWNIDGSSLLRLSRDGLRFRRDKRIPAKYQIGNELYRRNPLDRGHIARRADLVWGPRDEAKRANRDSFFYTNIAPQHSSFNQSSAGGIWGELENAIFSEVNVADLKISVIAGPVFSEDDQEYRGELIPKEFWKILFFASEGNDSVQAKAYLLTQQDLISDIETLKLPDFAVYEVPVEDIDYYTGFEMPKQASMAAENMHAQSSTISKPRLLNSISEALV